MTKRTTPLAVKPRKVAKDDGLSEPQQRAALLVAYGQPYDEIAAEVGVNYVTLWRWRDRADFQQLVDRINAAQERQVKSRIAAHASRLLTALAEYAEGKRDLTPDQLRTNLMLLGLAPNVSVGAIGGEALAVAAADAHAQQAQQVIVQVYENGARPDVIDG
jgi:hypothetical protein